MLYIGRFIKVTIYLFSLKGYFTIMPQHHPNLSYEEVDDVPTYHMIEISKTVKDITSTF